MPSQAEFLEIGIREILDRTSQVTEEVLRSAGGQYNTVLHMAASMASDIDQLAKVGLQRTISIDAALQAGDVEALAKLGVDRYQLPYQGATAPLGSLELVRTTSTPSVTVSASTEIEVRQVGASQGVRCKLKEDAVFSDGSSGPVAIEVVGIKAGSDQNVPGTAVVLTVTGSTPQAGITAQVPSGSTDILAGGNDAEDLIEYGERIRRWWRNVHRGTAGAIENAALDVPQVREASLWVAVDSAGAPYPAGRLVISDRDGNSNAALIALVQVNLGVNSEYEPAGFYTTPVGGQVTFREISWTGVYHPGKGTPANEKALNKAVAAAVNRLDPNASPSKAQAPQGSILTPSRITSALRSVGVLIEGSEESLSPVGPEAPEAGFMFRTTVDRVSRSSG